MRAAHRKNANIVSSSESSEEQHPNLRKKIKKGKKTRRDNSLGTLTEKFIQMLEQSGNGMVDLNDAVSDLKVEKRRIYDITNVLEGIGYIQKFKKSQFRLIDPQQEQSIDADLEKLQLELSQLEQEEHALERRLALISQELDLIMASPAETGQAYLNESDIKEHMVKNRNMFPCLIFQASPNTQVDIYQPKGDVGEGKGTDDDIFNYQVHIKSLTPLSLFYAHYSL